MALERMAVALAFLNGDQNGGGLKIFNRKNMRISILPVKTIVVIFLFKPSKAHDNRSLHFSLSTKHNLKLKNSKQFFYHLFLREMVLIFKLFFFLLISF